MTQAELLAYAQGLEKKASAKTGNGVQFRVGAKGGVSVYGLGRFPVTLYGSQWAKLFSIIPGPDGLVQFIADNAASLKVKPEAE